MNKYPHFIIPKAYVSTEKKTILIALIKDNVKFQARIFLKVTNVIKFPLFFYFVWAGRMFKNILIIFRFILRRIIIKTFSGTKNTSLPQLA